MSLSTLSCISVIVLRAPLLDLMCPLPGHRSRPLRMAYSSLDMFCSYVSFLSTTGILLLTTLSHVLLSPCLLSGVFAFRIYFAHSRHCRFMPKIPSSARNRFRSSKVRFSRSYKTRLECVLDFLQIINGCIYRTALFKVNCMLPCALLARPCSLDPVMVSNATVATC